MTIGLKRNIGLELSWGAVRGIFLASLIGLLVIWWYREPLAEAAVFHGIGQKTGLRASVGDIVVDFDRGAFRITDLKLHNPPRFHDPYLAEISELFIDFDAASFIQGKGRLPLTVLHIEKLWIVRSEKDAINLHALSSSSGKEQIEKFHLTIKEIIYKDYSVVTEPLTQHLPVYVERTYENLEGFGEIGNVLGYEALQNVVLNRLIPLNPAKFLQSNVFDPLTVANKAVTGTAGAVGQKVTGTAASVVGGIKDMAGSLLEAVSSPFRGEEEAPDPAKSF